MNRKERKEYLSFIKSIIKEEFEKQQFHIEEYTHPKEYINPTIIPEEAFTITISYEDASKLKYKSLGE